MPHRLWSPIRAPVVVVCFALGVWLAFYHPLAPVAAVAVFVAWCAASYRWPHIAFAALPAIIPIVDLAPWTGWIIVEEFDLVLLGAAAGTYASIAFGRQEQPGRRSSRLFHVFTLLFLGSASTPRAIHLSVGSRATLIRLTACALARHFASPT